MSLFEIYQPSRLHFNNVNPFCMDDTTGEYTFSPPFSSTEYSPDISSSMHYLETIFFDEYMEFQVHVDELHANTSIDDFQMDLDEFDHIFNGDANDIPKSLDETDESEESYFPQQSQSDGFHYDHAIRGSETSMDMTSMQPALVLPFEGMKVDNQLCLVHLLRAYAEAMDNQETELSNVIALHIIQKVNPVGGTTERLLYYMFQHLNRESDYLTQESNKNFYPAFKAFYQMFPYGKFVHFVANLAILEALPRDAEIIHLIDFDIGEGVQWASFMDSIKHQHKEIRVTSVKFNEEDETSPFRWRFEETKKRLCDHAGSYGLKIKVQEVGLQDLESMMRNIKTGDYGRKSWYVFNCNMGLPHMGRVRSRKDVLEFLRLAKSFLHHVTCWGTSNGIITYGDGDALHETTSCTLSYSSFLDANFANYQALLESMESSFPNHLGEARIALECLFVAPNVSSVVWDQKWEEKRQLGDLESGLGLEGLELSEAILVEAKELVKEGVSQFGVRIVGEKKNEMVMEWNGIPMVRVCCWKR